MIEVWIYPAKRFDGSIAKPGQWKVVGETEDMAFATRGVKAVAQEHGVARALLSDPEEGGWCGMIAYRHKGFSCWTGSGGRYGG